MAKARKPIAARKATRAYGLATPTLGLDLPRHDVKVKTLEEAKGPEMLEWIEQAGHSAGLEMRGGKMQFLGEVDALG